MLVGVGGVSHLSRQDRTEPGVSKQALSLVGPEAECSLSPIIKTTGAVPSSPLSDVDADRHAM